MSNNCEKGQNKLHIFDMRRLDYNLQLYKQYGIELSNYSNQVIMFIIFSR